MAKAEHKPSIVELIKSATDADLEAIDAEILERRNQIAKLDDEVYALKAMRRTIEVKLHGKPERKKPQRKPQASNQAAAAGEDNDRDRQRIHDYLSKHGPTKTGTIGDALGLHPRRVHALCQHDWFEQSLAGFSIA